MPKDIDLILMSEFKKALTKKGAAPYSNLDENFVQKFDFFLGRYEDVLKVTGMHIPPHKWSYQRIGLLTGGSTDHTSGIYRFTAKKDTLIIIPPRIITTSDWTPESTGYNLLFSFNFLHQQHISYKSLENKSILQPSIQPYLGITPEQSLQVRQIFETIITEKDSGDPFKNELIAVKIFELIILCERFHNETAGTQQSFEANTILKKFADLIEENFNQQHAVAFYAAQLHVHPNYLNAVIKTKTGITAKESIQNRLLLESKYLLHTTPLSIKEVAHNIGFEDPNYFSSFFKKFANMSPVAYRSSFL